MVLDYEGQCITSLPGRLNMSFRRPSGPSRSSQPCLRGTDEALDSNPTRSTNLFN